MFSSRVRLGNVLHTLGRTGSTTINNCNRIGINDNNRILLPRRTFTTSRPQWDVAKVTLVGRVGKDPYTKVLPSGKEIIEYAVATNHGYGENKKTSWWTVQCFSENSQKYLRDHVSKGSQVYVEGEITLSFVESPDGKSRTFTNIYHRDLTIVSKPKSGGTMGEDQQGNVVGGAIIGPDGQVIGSDGSSGVTVGGEQSVQGQQYVVGQGEVNESQVV